MGRLLLLLTAATLVLAACGDDRGGTVGDDPGAGGDTRLEEGEYVVTGLTEAGAPRATVPGSEIRIGFEDGTLRLNAGCNHLFGDYTLDGDQLTVGQVGGTEMGCPPALMEQDAWLADVLQRPIRVGTDPLTLTAGDVVLTLTPREQVSPDRPLVGTTWRLDGLVEGETASSVPEGGAATLELRADGTAVLGTGCNQGHAQVTVEDDRIRWEQVGVTKRGCDEPRSRLERHVLAVLQGTTTYTVRERTLTISNGDLGLTYVVKE